MGRIPTFLCAGATWFVSISPASAMTVNVDLDDLLGQYSLADYHSWGDGTGKTQSFNFGQSFPMATSFTMTITGQVVLPTYVYPDSSVQPGLINGNFFVGDASAKLPYLNYGIGFTLAESSHQFAMTGSSRDYNTNGYDFSLTLSMDRSFYNDQTNWDAGFPSGQVWTGLVFLNEYDPVGSYGIGPLGPVVQQGNVSITSAHISFTDSTPTSVPLPGTLPLFFVGMIGLIGVTSRRASLTL